MKEFSNIIVVKSWQLNSKALNLSMIIFKASKGIYDEFAFINSQLFSDDLIIHALNGRRPNFKETATAIHDLNSLISFEDLHDKLVEHKTFLERDELRSKSTPITINYTHKNGNKN